ncbi:unnamed protein product, partial [Scytosiphon promiscuus]
MPSMAVSESACALSTDSNSSRDNDPPRERTPPSIDAASVDAPSPRRRDEQERGFHEEPTALPECFSWTLVAPPSHPAGVSGGIAAATLGKGNGGEGAGQGGWTATTAAAARGARGGEGCRSSREASRTGASGVAEVTDPPEEVARRHRHAGTCHSREAGPLSRRQPQPRRRGWWRRSPRPNSAGRASAHKRCGGFGSGSGSGSGGSGAPPALLAGRILVAFFMSSAGARAAAPPPRPTPTPTPTPTPASMPFAIIEALSLRTRKLDNRPKGAPSGGDRYAFQFGSSGTGSESRRVGDGDGGGSAGGSRRALGLSEKTSVGSGGGSTSGSGGTSGEGKKTAAKEDNANKPKAFEALVVGGNFTLNGKSTNVAQYDPVSESWYSRFEPQLYLYGKAAGVVSDLAVWRAGSHDANPYDLLYVVGAFDTICKTCQQQYCSAGVWTGQEFDKIGDGLCGVPRATDSTMKMFASELTPTGNFFVGGTFESRVWSGEKFVDVQNVAVYQPRKNAWLPLQKDTGGGLGCNWAETRVMSLAWNDQDGILYIGGKFNLVDSEYIQPGLAIWSNQTGIAAFPGGGVSFDTPWWGDSSWVYDGVVTSLIYDDASRSLYVAGAFDRVNGEAPCQSIAVWRVDEGSWACLHEASHGFSVVTSLLYTSNMLYVAGVADEASSWAETWRAGYAFDGGAGGGDAGAAAAETNATKYTIARMSQSPTRFHGKYETWGEGDDDMGQEAVETGKGSASLSGKRKSGHRRQRSRRLSQQPRGQRRRTTDSGSRPRNLREDQQQRETGGSGGSSSSSGTHSDGGSTGFGFDSGQGKVYYAPTGGENCTASSTAKTPVRDRSSGGGDGEGEGGKGQLGAYKPMCGVDVVVSPGGDDKYRFYWEWLPAFSGVPGRINELGGGEGAFVDSVFIGGEFTPPVLVWRNDPRVGPSTTAIGAEGELQGLVTSITQMLLPPPGKKSGGTSESGGAAAGVAHPSTGHDGDTFTPGQEDNDNHALLMAMVLACMTIGVCLGAGMAFVCHQQEFMNLPWLKHMVEGRNGISLTTLAGPHGLMSGADAEFRLRFDRAMRARHLMKGHNLNIINPKEIMLHKIIGEGSFGRVWSGRWRSSSVAVKEFVFAQAAISGGSMQRNELIEEIVGEAAIMSVLQHPRILHLYGCSLTSQAIWIVSELCTRGSLRQVLDDRGFPLTPRARLRVAVDVAEGMLYLHSREVPVIHRDLKSHNIFMMEDPDGQLQPKIGDWGSARAVALYTGMRSMTHGVGTTCWLAPEVIKDAKCSEKADVYAFGILLWELATREQVYSGLSAAQIIDRVANQGLRPKAPRELDGWCLVVKCWQEDPLQRPDFREIVDVSTALLGKLGGGPSTLDVSRSLETPGTAEPLFPPSDGGSSGRQKDGGHAHHRHRRTPSGRVSRSNTPRSLSTPSSPDGVWGYTTISSNNSSIAS